VFIGKDGALTTIGGKSFYTRASAVPRAPLPTVFSVVQFINYSSIFIIGWCWPKSSLRVSFTSSVTSIRECSVVTRTTDETSGGCIEGGIRPGPALCRVGIWRGENIEFWKLVASGELAFATPLTLPCFGTTPVNCQCSTTPHKAVCTFYLQSQCMYVWIILNNTVENDLDIPR